MANRFMKTLRAGAITLARAAALYGMGSCWSKLDNEASRLRRPEEINFKYFNPSIAYDYSVGGTMGAETYAFDCNDDGIVDALGFARIARWYSQDWNGPKDKDAKLMTPEIIEKASELMNDSRELSRMMLDEAWRQKDLQPEK